MSRQPTHPSAPPTNGEGVQSMRKPRKVVEPRRKPRGETRKDPKTEPRGKPRKEHRKECRSRSHEETQTGNPGGTE